MSVLPGVLPQITQPYRQFAEGVQQFSAPIPVQLFATPVKMPNTMVPVDTFKNAQRAPGTPKAYGRVPPAGRA